jgi:hypothetical protein
LKLICLCVRKLPASAVSGPVRPGDLPRLLLNRPRLFGLRAGQFVRLRLEARNFGLSQSPFAPERGFLGSALPGFLPAKPRRREWRSSPLPPALSLRMRALSLHRWQTSGEPAE